MNPSIHPSILWQIANLVRDLQRLLKQLHPPPRTHPDSGPNKHPDYDDWLFPEFRDSP